MKPSKRKKMELEDLAVMVQSGFQGLESRMGARMDRMDNRMDGMATKDDLKIFVGHFNRRIDGLEVKIDATAATWIKDLDRVNTLEDQRVGK